MLPWLKTHNEHLPEDHKESLGQAIQSLMERIIRNAVMYDSPGPDKRAAEIKGWPWLVVQLITTRLHLFLAVRNGFTYQELGLGLPDGTIPAWVIAEHQAISAMYNQAYEDKTPR